MSSTTLVIIGEVFLVLIGIGGFLFFYLNNLNNQLLDKNQSLRKNLKDEKRHAKGLRVQIQDLTEKLQTIEKEFQAYRDEQDAKAASSQDLEEEYQAIQIQIAELEKQNGSLKTKLASAETAVNARIMEVEELNNKVKKLESESKVAEVDAGIDYEQMYHDLRNSIAYNMSGGEGFLETLRERLVENGNVEESRRLEELKERYNSLGEMVGLVSEVELFDSPEDSSDKEDQEKIDYAQGTVDSANELLDEAQGFDKDVCEIGNNEAEMLKILRGDLGEANLMNKRLRGELDRTSTQLKAFIKKAQAFQVQKEQIKMHKATQSQMHRDFVKINTEYKTLQRKYKTLESRNEILANQMPSSIHDNEKVAQLADVRQQLEAKEQEMDRMIVERDMLEQQFINISKESNLQTDSNEKLKLLTQEHKLLEAQFLEVLGELNTAKDDDSGSEETEMRFSESSSSSDDERSNGDSESEARASSV